MLRLSDQRRRAFFCRSDFAVFGTKLEPKKIEKKRSSQREDMSDRESTIRRYKLELLDN